MSEKKVVLITGAGRGMGVDIARAALDAGHRVVATARNADRVTRHPVGFQNVAHPLTSGNRRSPAVRA